MLSARLLAGFCKSLVAVVIVGSVLSLLNSQAARSQSAACAVFDKDRAKAMAAIRQKQPECSVRCRGCGCKGGPGYRNNDGRCVSYNSLIKECGPPPHTRCRPECEEPVVTCPAPPTTAVNTLIQERKLRRGCGSNGGTGYRGPNGRCVSWKNLRKVCGNPPTTNCSAENVQPGPARSPVRAK